MSDKPVLLLDLGGVLANLGDPVSAMQLEMSSDSFWTTWVASPAVHDFETGAIDESAFVPRIAKELGAGEDSDFRTRLHQWQLRLFPEVADFLKEAAKHWRLALLSNTNPIHWRQVTEENDAFADFDKLFLSFETGQFKPSPAAFEQVLEHYGCEASDILFLDDSVANTTAATAIGLSAEQTIGTPMSAYVRIPALRELMQKLAVDGLLVPHDDEYLNEYTPPQFERLRWATGFSGSAGSLLLLRDRAVLFIDGRYTEQARIETPSTLFDYEDLRASPPDEWIRQNSLAVTRLAYCGALHTRAEIQKLEAISSLELVSLGGHPVDELWCNRPGSALSSPFVHPLSYAGETSEAKRARVADGLQGADCTVFTNPNDTAWLLNIRGNDVPNTPVTLCRSVLHVDGRAIVFFPGHEVPDSVREELGKDVTIASEAEFSGYLASLGAEAKRVLLDPARCPDFVWQCLAQSGAEIVEGNDPLGLLRARKNNTEIEAARDAHIRDGVAMVRFLRWLENNWTNDLTEFDVVEKLESLRRDDEEMRGPSFDTISGSGPNGAIIHYRVDESSNRILRDGDLLLLDSGGQYFGATTDITRTIPLGKQSQERRDRYTRVLKGHIGLAMAVFPQQTTGAQLDVLARQSLWAAGLDFAHGTGHGVGTFLGVHEGPQSIAKRTASIGFEAGMTITIEPGFYVEGEYGIRIENIALLVDSHVDGMLEFDALTLAPINTTLIDRSLLSDTEIGWLNAYHETVFEKLAPRLSAEDKEWLQNACTAL